MSEVGELPPETGRQPRSRAALGALLIVLGALFWVLHSLQAHTERHSYAHGGAAPTRVTLTAGRTYSIAVPGGVGRESSFGLDSDTLRCTGAAVGAAPQRLSLTAEAQDTKATNQIASFVAPGSGSYAVRCGGIPAATLYVDDADGAGLDLSLLWLVLACVSFLAGVPLVLSGLRRPRFAD